MELLGENSVSMYPYSFHIINNTCKLFIGKMIEKQQPSYENLTYSIGIT